MPTTPEAVGCSWRPGSFGPGKAANAGGVAPRRWRCSRTRPESPGPSAIRARLAQIMRGIHDRCLRTAETYGAPGNYVVGANVAAFTRVADAMLALGMV